MNSDGLSKPRRVPRISTSSSFRVLFQCATRNKQSIDDDDDDDSQSTDSSSSNTVIRQTTSWRWLIVFGSFFVHFIADGVLFSFGILMHLIKDDLKIELHTVGTIASLFVSLPLLLAPISGALVNKVGCRPMTMFGGLICSLGLILASFSGNFIGAFMGIGVCCGVGLSCVYVPAVVIVAHYFDENRAIATGIAVGGTGLGNAIVAQLIHHLNNYYDDWRGTTLFLSGVLFTIVGFGTLFRPVEFLFHRKTKNSDFTKNDKRLPPSCMTSVEKLERFIEEMDAQRAKRQKNQSTCSTATSNHETFEIDLFDSYSADDIKEFDDEIAENINRTVLKEKLKRYPTLTMRQMMKNSQNKANLEKYRHSTHSAARSFTNFLSLPREEKEKKLLEIYQQPISQKDIFYPGNVPIKTSNLSRTSCPDLIEAYVYEESATCLSEDENLPTEQTYRRYFFYRKSLTFLHSLRRMLGLNLFHDYRYTIFFISQFLFYLFYDLIYIFPVDYGETVIGYSKKQMTNLVTVLGFGQFFGQILFGLVANYSIVDEMILYDIGAILCGISSFFIPFVVHSYTLLVLVMLLFGLSISANYALTSVILANMCGLDLLTSAYGLILLGQGLSSLFGPVVGGWIAEKFGYRLSLIVAGIFMALSGFVPILIPIIRWFRRNDKNIINDQTMMKNKSFLNKSDDSRENNA